MGNSNVRYTPELKRRAVDLCSSSGTTYAAVARDLGIDDGTLATRITARST